MGLFSISSSRWAQPIHRGFVTWHAHGIEITWHSSSLGDRCAPYPNIKTSTSEGRTKLQSVCNQGCSVGILYL